DTGMGPVNQFDCRCNSVKAIDLPKESGIEPVK
ncbi:hypothetical protein Tco_0690837, partial [Tanacetum coccineum]